MLWLALDRRGPAPWSSQSRQASLVHIFAVSINQVLSQRSHLVIFLQCQADTFLLEVLIHDLCPGRVRFRKARVWSESYALKDWNNDYRIYPHYQTALTILFQILVVFCLTDVKSMDRCSILVSGSTSHKSLNSQACVQSLSAKV